MHPHLIMLPWANPSLNPKWQLDTVQPFLHSSPQSVPALYHASPLPPSKLSLPMGDLDPRLIHGSLDTRVLNPKRILIGSAIFAQLTAECPYTLQWDTPFPLKIVPSHGGSGPHLIHGFLGPPKSSTHTASQSVQPFLQGSLV